MKIATIVDMADALAVTHDTIALLLAPTVISAVASNIIALMSHRMRKTDPEQQSAWRLLVKCAWSKLRKRWLRSSGTAFQSSVR
jgi:hypothetical protein